MIGHNRLYDCQPEPCTVLLAGVVGREQALTLLRSQSASGVNDFKIQPGTILPRAESECPALRHSIHSIQHEVRNCSM